MAVTTDRDQNDLAELNREQRDDERKPISFNEAFIADPFAALNFIEDDRVVAMISAFMIAPIRSTSVKLHEVLMEAFENHRDENS